MPLPLEKEIRHTFGGGQLVALTKTGVRSAGGSWDSELTSSRELIPGTLRAAVHPRWGGEGSVGSCGWSSEVSGGSSGVTEGGGGGQDNRFDFIWQR